MRRVINTGDSLVSKELNAQGASPWKRQLKLITGEFSMQLQRITMGMHGLLIDLNNRSAICSGSVIAGAVVSIQRSHPAHTHVDGALDVLQSTGVKGRDLEGSAVRHSDAGHLLQWGHGTKVLHLQVRATRSLPVGEVHVQATTQCDKDDREDGETCRKEGLATLPCRACVPLCSHCGALAPNVLGYDTRQTVPVHTRHRILCMGRQ